MTEEHKTPKIGLALGSGAARGWAHIGIIRELKLLGIEADIICGTSMGALVGALYAANSLEEAESMALGMSRMEIVRFLDLKLLSSGGFIEGKRLMNAFQPVMGGIIIENMQKCFAAVATDLETGHEVWIREGLLIDAVRASISLPGILTPVKIGGRWHVDGGIVNPVPVSLCRAMGADIVIAVNLNSNIAGRHFRKKAEEENGSSSTNKKNMLNKLSSDIRNRADSIIGRIFDEKDDTPGLFDVIAGSINIMQDRITRSRMAGDPPDIIISPSLAHIGLLEFDRGKEAIEEGKEAVRLVQKNLEALFRAR